MVAQALWHLSLPPNSEIPLLIHHDIQITNASLTATLADENARSVVTMTFQPTNPRELDGEDSGDEDEDEFSGEEGSDEEDDGEELDEEEIAKAVAAATGGKSSKSKGKTNGSALPTEVEAEGDAEEDEELDSDEEDISLTEEPVTSTLCALTPGKIEGISLNLILNEDEVVIFKNEGKNEIHLLGNYIDQIPFQGGRDDYDDMESESEYSYDSDEEGPLDFDEDEMSEMEGMDIDMEDLQRVVGRGGKGKKSDSHRFEVVDEEESKPKSKKAEKPTATPVEIANAAIETSKKRKADSASTPEKAKADAGKKLKNDKGEAVPAAAKKVEEKKVEAKKVEKKEKKDEKPEKASSKKVTHPSGLVMEDVKVGEGPVAGKGKRCGMRYIGKLQNGKQFDANTAGAPFTFRLGAGEVIKGWDIGVAGMKVGGERKLTIPANLAYGNQKIPGIPPNSTLVFDIKLVNVK